MADSEQFTDKKEEGSLKIWVRGVGIAQVPQEIVRQQPQQQQQQYEIATVATMWQMDGDKCFEWFVAPNNQKQFKTLAPKRNEGTTTKRQQLWVAKKERKEKRRREVGKNPKGKWQSVPK